MLNRCHRLHCLVDLSSYKRCRGSRRFGRRVYKNVDKAHFEIFGSKNEIIAVRMVRLTSF